jgi:hypothetical protein
MVGVFFEIAECHFSCKTYQIFYLYISKFIKIVELEDFID